MNDAKIQLMNTLITLDSSIRDCLAIIDELAVQTIVVVDDDTCMVGVVAERDIRKALIGGAVPADTIKDLVGPAVATVTPADSRAEVLDVMRALRIREVPIVDGDGRVIGVHSDREIVGAASLPNWAVVMAGGRGTRLAPLTDDTPKPMLPVAGRPILERIVLHLVGAGIRRIFISVNYLGELIEQYFGDGSAHGCSIEYLREERDRPLGTGGALSLLADRAERPTAPVLLMNGDLVTGFSVADLLAEHTRQRVVATIATSEYEHQVPFGVLESDAERLVRIVEKPTSSWPVNAGIYVLEPSLLAHVPRGEAFPIIRLFDDCLVRGEPVGLWPIRDQWQDIGRPEELSQAQGTAP